MTTITVLDKGNISTGPFSREQIREKLKQGEFTMSSLAFAEGLGLSQWVPLRDVLGRIAAASAPVFDATRAGAATYSREAITLDPENVVYAGFWLRFVAYVIDTIIIEVTFMFAAFVPVFLFIGIGQLVGINLSQPFPSGPANAKPAVIIFILLMELVIWGGMITLFWLYFAKLESGPSQATYGKRIMGIHVTDLSGQRISFGRASGRFFGKIVSALPMDIGFIMAAFTDRKQALHDMIAGTLVLKG
jgi:uncharacterized RDD family membrane protein YckC